MRIYEERIRIFKEYSNGISVFPPVSTMFHFQNSQVTSTRPDIGSPCMERESTHSEFIFARVRRKFVNHEASMNGDAIETIKPSVRLPTAVSFGWVKTPEVNLTDREGLPAAPFRADSPNAKN
jgi:sialate O-acetylesterase